MVSGVAEYRMPDAVMRIGATLAELLVIAIGFYFLASIGLEFNGSAQRIAVVWFPNAALFVYLLRRPGCPLVPALAAGLLGNIAANVHFGDKLEIAALLALANTLEILVATKLSRRYCGSWPDLSNFSVVVRLLTISGLLAPALSATVAALTLGLDQGTFDLRQLVQWFITDALDMTLGGVCLLALCDGFDRRHRINWEKLPENVLWFMGGTVILIAVFYQTNYPLLFLSAPIVLFHTMRQGIVGAAICTIQIAVIAIVATVYGHGPIALVQGSLIAKAFVLQLYLAVILLMGIPHAALLEVQRRTLRKLARRDAHISLLADWSSDAVMAFNGQGICCFASAAAERLLLRSRDEIIGTHVATLMNAGDVSAYQAGRARLFGLETDVETLLFSPLMDEKDATEVFLEARITRVPADRVIDELRVIASVRDVTDAVRLRQELISARELAEHAALVKSRFLANMSHEIRTPMNGVLGFAELLVNDGLPEPQHRRAELIVESGKSMMRLLNDILDISKIEVGGITVAHEPVDLLHLLRSCISFNLALAQENGLELRSDFCRDLPELVSGDALRLRQIILNLLGNAIKFTASGTVTLSARQVENRLQIAITDTGIGIAADRVQSIFAPFEQADNDIARRFGGTGLGLSISNQLAELMDGTLTVESSPGVGSCFTLALPLIAVESFTLRNEVKVATKSSSPANGARRVLLVDDHDINRELATEMLHRLGCTVTVACNGFEAVERISEAGQGRAFDLVLMDVQMPICDGYEATRAIRRDCREQRDMPIVAMTANAYPEDIAAALATGMQDHLAKPITTANLSQILDRWLESGVSEVPQVVAVAVPTTPPERLQQLWHKNRNQAVEQVRTFLDQEDDPQVRAELARLMHQIAGTAQRFDEAPLGALAASLEYSMRSGGSTAELRVLANKLLELT